MNNAMNSLKAYVVPSLANLRLALLGLLTACALVAGCRAEPTRAPLVGEVVEPPEKRPSPWASDLPPHRRPSVAGDVLIYPVRWRKADELGLRLYQILAPKYGSQIQIVPDPVNNALLIYLHPEARGQSTTEKSATFDSL